MALDFPTPSFLRDTSPSEWTLAGEKTLSAFSKGVYTLLRAAVLNFLPTVLLDRP